MTDNSTPTLIEFETPRLRLRQWRESDCAPFAAMAADPQVMEFLLPLPTRADSDAMVGRGRALIAAKGWGFWAVEHKATGEFIGFTGLNVPLATLPFSPCVEIGWRFARHTWGQGFASEAARGALQVGFERLGFDEIVAFTTLANRRSRAVMERLGMREDRDGEFDHPLVADGHPLQRHRLYRIGRAAWEASRGISE
jgi:RimJ/RimL family protein N-acetyltransferase